MDFEKLEQQTYSSVEGSNAPRQETTNNEDGSQTKQVIAYTSAIAQAADSFLYHFTDIITKTTIGTISDTQRFFKTGGQTTGPFDKNRVYNLLYAMQVASSWGQESVPVFTTTIPALRDSMQRFEKLCERLEKEKNAQLSRNRGTTTPKFSFIELSSKMKKVLKELESFLKQSFTFALREYLVSVEAGDYSFYGFDTERTVSYDEANTRLLSCEISFTTLPKVSFDSAELFKLQRNGDGSALIPFENWFEIRFVKFQKRDIEGGLYQSDFVNLTGTNTIYVHRNMLFGGYKDLRELLVDDSIRNVWNQFYSIKESFLTDEQNSLTWEDFCAFYVRPPITVVEEKEWKTLSKDLKSLDEKLKEDKKIYDAKERKRVVEKNKGKKDETDSGFLEDLKRDLKNTKDLDGLYAALNKTKLGALAKASFDCLHKVSMFSKDETNPELFDPFSSSIPDIRIPKFSLPEIPVMTGPSQNVVPLALEQIKGMVLEATIAQLDSFFTVEKCEDFGKFFNKRAWEALKNALQDALRADWDSLVSMIQLLIGETSCFSAEDLLSILYKSADVLSPEKVIALLNGDQNSPNPYELAELACLVLGAEVVGRCGIPRRSLVTSVAAAVNTRLPGLIDELGALADDPPQDFVLESKIKCETSYDNFMQWLLNNGLPTDKVECLINTTKDDKSKFLRGLESYIKNKGASSPEDPFVIDSSVESTILQMCESEFSNVFDAFSKNVVDYPLFVTAGTGAQFGATIADTEFLGSINTDMAGKAKTLGGFDLPENWNANEPFLSAVPRDFVPFFEIVTEVFSVPEFSNRLFPEFILFGRDTRAHYPNKKEIYEFSYNGFTTSLEKYFGPLRGHKRILKFGVSDVEVGGVPFVVGERHSEIIPVWSMLFADKALTSLPSVYSEQRQNWMEALGNGVIKQLRNSFIDFLAVKARGSLVGQTVSFQGRDAGRTVPAVEVLAKYLQRMPSESCANGEAVFGKDAFCKHVANLVKEEMIQRREYKYDLVKPIGLIDLSPRVAALNFLLGTPFLGEMFTSYSPADRILSNYILWKFPELQDELERYSDFIRVSTDSVFTNDDLLRTQGLDDEEVMDNSGDESLKTVPVGRIDTISFASLDHIKSVHKTQENLNLIASGFANFLGSNKTWMRSWVESLPVWQIAKYRPNEQTGFGSFAKKVLFSVGIEAFSGSWKCVKISGGSYAGSNVFVNFGNENLKTAAENSSNSLVAKYRASLNLNVFSEVVSEGTQLGVGSPFRLISPVVSVEFDKGNIDSDSALISAAVEALSGDDQLKKVLEENLCFGELFELFNVFLFELTNRTTNFGRFLGDGLKFSPESGTSLTTQVQALNSVANDTFGILRSKFSISDIQKMALKMALKTPYLIFKSQVEMVDPVIRKARKIVDEARLRGMELDFARVALFDLRPANLWLLLAKSPPITPAGILYAILERKNKSSEEFSSIADAEGLPEVSTPQGTTVGFGKMCVRVAGRGQSIEQYVQEEPC